VIPAPGDHVTRVGWEFHRWLKVTAVGEEHVLGRLYGEGDESPWIHDDAWIAVAIEDETQADPYTTAADICHEVLHEVHRAAEKHGTQLDLPMFHPFGHEIGSGASCKFTCRTRSSLGEVAWADIFLEEAAEAFDENLDPALLRAELIQTAAMAVAWIRALDHQEAKK
jgi:hypothetical protein